MADDIFCVYVARGGWWELRHSATTEAGRSFLIFWIESKKALFVVPEIRLCATDRSPAVIAGETHRGHGGRPSYSLSLSAVSPPTP